MSVAVESQGETISLKIFASSGLEASITIASSATLRSLQQELYHKFNVPRSHQRLFYGGRELCDLELDLQLMGIGDGQVLHLSMSEPQLRDVSAMEAKSCLRQLMIPSHSGVETSLGMYAEASWTDEERAKAMQNRPEETTGDAEHVTEEKSFWEQLFIPSFSGVETSLGSYAQSSLSDEKRIELSEETRDPAPARDTSIKNLALPPLWYRLFIPSDSGVVATLGSYADPTILADDINKENKVEAQIPWDTVVAAVDDLMQKDGYQITRLDSASTQATAQIAHHDSISSIQSV